MVLKVPLGYKAQLVQELKVLPARRALPGFKELAAYKGLRVPGFKGPQERRARQERRAQADCKEQPALVCREPLAHKGLAAYKDQLDYRVLLALEFRGLLALRAQPVFRARTGSRGLPVLEHREPRVKMVRMEAMVRKELSALKERQVLRV
jgi:hypothetical protein